MRQNSVAHHEEKESVTFFAVFFYIEWVLVILNLYRIERQNIWAMVDIFWVGTQRKSQAVKKRNDQRSKKPLSFSNSSQKQMQNWTSCSKLWPVSVPLATAVTKNGVMRFKHLCEEKFPNLFLLPFPFPTCKYAEMQSPSWICSSLQCPEWWYLPCSAQPRAEMTRTVKEPKAFVSSGGTEVTWEIL